MRILFDARSVRTPAGITVFQGLTRGWLKDERVAQVYAAIPRTFAEALIPSGVHAVRVRTTPWPWHLAREIPAVARQLRADVIFAPNALPLRDRHAVAYFQDLFHFRRSASRSPAVGCGLRKAVRRAWWAYALRGWRLGVSVSKDIEHEVKKHLPIRVRTIPNGVDVGEMRWSGQQPYIFVMGGTGARKAEGDAIQAWSQLTAVVRHGMQLIVGGVEPARRRRQLCALAKQLRVTESVIVLGSLPRRRFLAHIASARFVVSCSALEAANLPVAEALGMGAPVVCSNIPAHAELLARADAGATFPLHDVAALGALFERGLGGDLPRRLAVMPPSWSWDARAREHLDWYEHHFPPAA